MVDSGNAQTGRGAARACAALGQLSDGAFHDRVWEHYFPDGPNTWERFCVDTFGYPAAFIDAIRQAAHTLEHEFYTRASGWPGRAGAQDIADEAYVRGSGLARLANVAIERRLWQNHFNEEPRTWQRYCAEVFGCSADFVDRVRESFRILNYQTGESEEQHDERLRRRQDERHERVLRELERVERGVAERTYSRRGFRIGSRRDRGD